MDVEDVVMHSVIEYIGTISSITARCNQRNVQTNYRENGYASTFHRVRRVKRSLFTFSRCRRRFHCREQKQSKHPGQTVIKERSN